MVKQKPIKEEKKRDYRILPVRKEEEFVKIDRELPEPFKPIFEKNGAYLWGGFTLSHLQHIMI